MKTMINPQAIEPSWGGVLNLTLGKTMSEQECLEIVQKLDDISQNKFYTINVWDTSNNQYYGDTELYVEYENQYNLICTFVGSAGTVGNIVYRFYKNGTFERVRTDYSLSNILARLDKIEQQLGI